MPKFRIITTAKLISHNPQIKNNKVYPMKMNNMGHWAFLLGIVVAIIGAFITGYSAMMSALLVLLGVVVGLLNISEKEVTGFLIAVIALLTAGTAGIGSLPIFGMEVIIGSILRNIAVFVAPAAVIVALKAVYQMGSK